MHVRAGRKTGGTDKSDHFALPHDLADLRGDAAHVPVACLEATGMDDLDLLPITPVPAGADDSAFCRSDDWGSGRSGEIDALVEAHVTQDRMETLSKGGGEAAFDRKPDARAVFSSDPVRIDPDCAFPVGPLEELDVGARDAVEADVQELAEFAFAAALDDEVEAIVYAETVCKTERPRQDGNILLALDLGHAGRAERIGEVLADDSGESSRRNACLVNTRRPCGEMLRSNGAPRHSAWLRRRDVRNGFVIARQGRGRGECDNRRAGERREYRYPAALSPRAASSG